ncbi:MAG: hypothetical protein N3G20_03630 [Verrucomicrobiae bacterium]|nr:hypothetical protein [Verrucomicrobiae bacterium]
MKIHINTDRIIPLGALVTDRGGPVGILEFNRYHLHLWSVVCFVMEGAGGTSRAAFRPVIREGGSSTTSKSTLGNSR